MSKKYERSQEDSQSCGHHSFGNELSGSGGIMEFRSAKSKIARAKELTEEVCALLATNPPYSYCLETDISTGQRSTFAKRDEDALDKVVIRCGDILHNLRSALDHAYWEAVSPFIDDSSKHGAIQFPFAKDASKLESAIRSRLAHKVSNEFYLAIEGVKPHAGIGGNTLLNLVHEINIVDKHKFPTPVGDFTRISSDQLCVHVPDFPKGMVNCGFGQNGRDVVWHGRFFDAKTIGELIPHSKSVFHKKLDVPVGLMFSIPEPWFNAPVIDTLKKMTDEIERILNVMKDSIITRA